MNFSKTLTAAVAGCLLCAAPVLAAPVTITFDEPGLVHGTIVNTQYTGVTISAKNADGNGPDLAVAFNTNTPGAETSDDDLLKPWDAGNIPSATDLGNILIIQENSTGTNDGIADDPDDEGRRPAGSIFFDFDFEIDSFGFDLVDVEGSSEYTNGGYFATFYSGSTVLGSVGFGDFVNSASSFYDPTVVFGNNSANQIAPITAAMFGIDYFDLVEINFGGSAGIDNITFTETPIPAAAWLFASALGLFGYLGKRKSAA